MTPKLNSVDHSVKAFIPFQPQKRSKITRNVCAKRIKITWIIFLGTAGLANTYGVGPLKSVIVVECYFLFPEKHITLLCCDGASKCNPGLAGYGFVVRNHLKHFEGTESGGPGVATNYIAKIMAAICAMQWAVTHQRWRIIIHSASKAILYAFMNRRLPWMFWSRAAAAAIDVEKIVQALNGGLARVPWRLVYYVNQEKLQI
ncbi:hypothetical protein C5167_021854 [Papaver somniferum]|uniref:RNase H type-1 domain-containing protein n=1 Tax=Papaver somniferum TaxID=3469 RepID=A0A4Y7JK10_PAPSO|nr:hypothetical protein C5167_021854 [Papaver somniferum]